MSEPCFHCWMSKNLNLWNPSSNPEVRVFFWHLEHIIRILETPNDLAPELLKSLVQDVNAPLFPFAFRANRNIHNWYVISLSSVHPVKECFILLFQNRKEITLRLGKWTCDNEVWWHRDWLFKTEEAVDHYCSPVERIVEFSCLLHGLCFVSTLETAFNHPLEDAQTSAASLGVVHIDESK